jgi:hypothetical protein
MLFRAPECTFPAVSASGEGRGGPAAVATMRGMLSLVMSTVAFFVAVYFIKRHLDGIGVPKTAARGLVVFVLALAAAYGVAFLVDRVAG